MSGILDLIYPGICPLCDRPNQRLITDKEYAHIGICSACSKKIKKIKKPFCVHCGKPLETIEDAKVLCGDCQKRENSPFDQGRAVFVYKGEMTLAMYRMKYSKKRDYARAFAVEAYDELGDWIERVSPDVIIPIPLHEKRLLDRGYNQALDLATELSKLTGIPVDNQSLTRIKNTVPQKDLDDKNRDLNIKNAFHTVLKDVEYNRVLLVDDIYTTGSTVSAAAYSLKNEGVGAVYVLCICIGTGD